MTPNSAPAQGQPAHELEDFHGSQAQKKSEPLQIIWRNVFILLKLHIMAIYGWYLVCVYASWKLLIYVAILSQVSALGLTAGAHRLWSHRSYKAKIPLRIFLASAHFLTLQNHLYQWVRDHRLHHKFDGTNADPHNINRGFFFAHIGWLMIKSHKDVIEKEKTIDFSDLMADPVVRMQYKLYYPIFPICCFFVAVSGVPYYFWNERWDVCLFGGVLYYAVTLNVTFCINSVCHIWGTKPYDKNINATEYPLLSVLTTGEGFHNYHHTFPWDYSVSEFGYKYNMSTIFINCMARIGQAYDLKKAPAKDVYQSKIKKGDGSYFEKQGKDK